MWRRLPIRAASLATTLVLAFLATGEFAGAQIGSVPPQAEVSPLALPLLSPGQMAPDARASAQSWRPAIASSAQFFGYTVDSSYTYRQIACPVAPHHLLLAYEAAAPNGAVSRFTAIVPLGAEEETSRRHPAAQIIPILHFGVVPFVPAIANPHSIEVFNAAVSAAPNAIQVLADAQAGRQPLLVRSLCYLAIVGAEPAVIGSPPGDLTAIHAPLPTLVFQDRAKIRQVISVRSGLNSYQVWALTFQSGGNLLSATRQERPVDRTPLAFNAANSGPPTDRPPAAAPIASAESPAPGASPSAAPGPPGDEAGQLPSGPAPAASAATAGPPAVAATPIAPTPLATVPVISAPEPAAPAAPAPISALPASSVARVPAPPVVKPSPPLPPGRFIPDPPRPPSRFIPDSALHTPPHLPQ